MASKAFLVAGLGFGDEGKGTITDYLAKRHNVGLVVRYNGGAQAAHNVITDDGRHHTFSQFGSGTFQNAFTYLSRFMVVDPMAMLKEAGHLETVGVVSPMSRVFVDKDALVILPYHRAANRIRERQRGAGRHGSCGVGVGETRGDFIAHGYEYSATIGDLFNRDEFVRKAKFIRTNKMMQVTYAKDDLEAEWFEISPEDLWKKYKDFRDAIAENVVDISFLARHIAKRDVIFEGAQGVLLDEKYGFQPYTTWTDITFNNAYTLLKYVGYQGDPERIGILRSYTTRHGAGPMPTENPRYNMGEQHNKLDAWQGKFREGPLDIPLTRYAINVLGGVDCIAMTHMDAKPTELCYKYEAPDPEATIYLERHSHALRHLPMHRMDDALKYTDQLGKFLQLCHPVNEVFTLSYAEFLLGAHIKILSNGPKTGDKVERTIDSLY